MPLRQHLEELRGCVARSGMVLAALFIGGMIFDNPLVAFMIGPWDAARAAMIADGVPDPGMLAFIKPTEGFLFSMKVAGAFALLVGGPYLLWEVWRFVGAGLHLHERRSVKRALPFAMALFVLGLSFGFYVVVPISLPILLTWVSVELAHPTITLQEFLSLLLTLTLLLGFVFELPVLMWLVVRAGLMEADTLASSRKLAMLLMLVFAAIMTPPDVITQIFVALPMFVLYEIGLLLAKRAQAARERAAL
ncbi:MAG: twin-arginine translocase subunit TatC [Planctomycetota bacterium]|nr:MAG: twin-arginine translocase subunit TatC [Planctomycetota bacterium]